MATLKLNFGKLSESTKNALEALGAASKAKVLVKAKPKTESAPPPTKTDTLKKTQKQKKPTLSKQEFKTQLEYFQNKYPKCFSDTAPAPTAPS